MPVTDYSNNYLLYNSQVTKQLVIAVEIDGVPDILTSSNLYKRVRYGDPNINYGDSGLVYGGLVTYGNFKSILDFSGGSMTLSQRLEPEQGRGAISTISLSFVDLNGYMTEIISPGVVVDDILGKPVKVYLGYQEIAFPEDYTVIFRGRVSAYDSLSGRVTLQFSDPNMARKQSVFYSAKTTLSADITSTDTTISVASNSDFHKQILGPDGSYDSAVTTYIKIGDEFIEYPATGFGTNQFTGCTRGARSTVNVAHSAGDDVEAWFQIQDHCIDMALKLMLSGWNGPYQSDIAISSFKYTGDPSYGNNQEVIVLPTLKDAARDYGIAVGDYITVTGSAASANNNTFQVLDLVSLNDEPANGIVVDGTLSFETASSAVFSVRSQFDTYPISCGVKLPGTEVDVARHINIKDTFLGSDENRLRFLIGEEESSCKTFIESQIYLPTACYSLTRFGKLSIQLTHAPLADERLQFLTADNVLNAQNIMASRGVNNRKFFNEIDWTYDYDDAGNPVTTVKTLDSESISIIGVVSVLPMDAKGIRTDLGTTSIITRRTNYLLSRYKKGAILINIQTNWEVGSLIESGDVVAVQDGGVLQISNLATGQRNLGTQLFEVIDRSIDMKTGIVSLQLVSGLGAEVTDRYACISPSSIIQSGSTNTELKIDDSFGALYPGQEYRKWQDYLGLRVIIHDDDYTVSSTATLTSLGSVDPNTLIVSGLSISPSAGMILDIDNYSESTDTYDQETLKVIHAFWSKQEVAASGISTTQFQVPASAIGYYQDGFPLVMHNDDWSQESTEVLISNVDTGTNIITVDRSLGFTPTAGNLIDLLGFPDGRAAYRWI